MKTVTSTEARQGFSKLIAAAEREPVIISKKNKQMAVILSSSRYNELQRIEDLLYGKAAKLAIEEGLASKEEAEDLLDSIT
jgi:prevent-host-death family protein